MKQGVPFGTPCDHLCVFSAKDQIDTCAERDGDEVEEHIQPMPAQCDPIGFLQLVGGEYVDGAYAAE